MVLIILLTAVVLLAAVLVGACLQSVAPVAPEPHPTPAPSLAAVPTAVPSPSAAPAPSAPIVTPQPSSGLTVGFRASSYAITPMPSPDYWYEVGADAQSKFSRSGIGGIWVIGCYLDDGDCYLNFPSSARYPGTEFSETDENEEYLSDFDRKGVSVYLQVEPGQASVEDLIRLVLDRYSHHPCVAGFGVDVEWYRRLGNAGGKPVTDQEAAAWYRLVSSYNKNYKLLLKHYRADWMPPTYRTGVFFVDDSMGFASLGEMVDEFAEWGGRFPDSPVGFQIGYPEDKSWWGGYDDPYTKIGRALADAIPNVKGIYWVDFSVTDLYPV